MYLGIILCKAKKQGASPLPSFEGALYRQQKYVCNYDNHNKQQYKRDLT